MKALKISVIVMGVLIAIGFVFVVVTIIGRLTGEAPAPVRGNVTLEAGPGCSLADAWSADGFLYLRITGPEDCPAVLLFDPKTQEQVGRISLGQGGQSVE